MQHKDIIHLQPFYDENTKTLDLSSQGVTDQDVIDYIVPFLHEHPDINGLNLDNNDIGDEGVAALISALKNTHITKLSFANNDPEGEKPPIGRALLTAISSLPTLIEVDISNNTIFIRDDHYEDDYDRDSSLNVLSKELSNHPQLVKLNVSHNCIRSEKLFTTLLSIPTLTELNISKNGLVEMPTNIPSSCHLIKLDVSHNGIIGIISLVKLALIQTLKELNIRSNRIGRNDYKTKKIKNAESMLSKSCLVKLNVSNNGIKSGYTFTALAATIPTLTELDVSENNIRLKDIDEDEVRQALKNSRIIKLNMSRNAMGAAGFRSIVNVIPTLTELSASDIEFKPEYLEALAINRQVSKLDISNNSFTPWWLEPMSKLVVVFPNLVEIDCSSIYLGFDFDEKSKLVNLASLRKLTIDTCHSEIIINLFHNPCFEELNMDDMSISSSLVRKILDSDLLPIKKFNFSKHMLRQLLQAEKNGERPGRASAASLITPELAIALLYLAVPVNEKINFLKDVIYSSSVNLITSELINEISNSNLPPHEKINLLRQIRHKINIAEEEGEKINISEEEKKDLKEKADSIPSLFDLTKSHLLQSTPELKECDLLVIEVADIKEYTDSLTDIVAAAQEKKLPMIVFIRSHIRYYIYGDKNNDGNWDLMRITDISSLHLLPLFDINKKSRQDSTTNTLTRIKRNELSPVLIKQLALYHSNLSPMEARIVIEQNPNTAPYYDKWHERISELKKIKLDSSEKIEDFLKLASKWADELIKDKKEVEGKTEEIIISNEKKDLLRFLGIVNERYLTPKWDEAKKLIDKEKAARIAVFQANETAKEIAVEWNRRGTVAIAYLRSDSKMTEEEEIVFLRTAEENIPFLRRASSLKEEFANDKKIIRELSCHETIKAEAIAKLDYVHSYQIEPVVNEIKKKVSAAQLQDINKINDGLDEDIQQLEGLDCQLNTLMGQMLVRFDGNILENNGDVDTLDQGFFKSIEDLIKNRAQLEQGISAKEEQLSQLLAQCKGIGLDSAKLTSAQQTVLEQNTRLSALNLAYQYTVNTFDNNKKMAAKIREMQAVYDETKKRLTQAQTVLKQSDQHLRSKITAANRIATQGINPVYFHKHKFVYAYEDQLIYLQQCERKLKETADASSQILLALIAEEEVIEKINLKSAINHINLFQYADLRVNLDASKSTIEEMDKQILDMKTKIHAKVDGIHVFQNTLNKKLNEVSEKIINWQGKLDDFEKLKMSLVASKPFKALREYAKGSAKWMQINAYLNDIKSAKTKSELIRAVKANHKDVILKSYYGKEKKLEREEYYFEHTMRENTGCGFYGLFHGRGKSTTDAYAIQLQDVLDKLLDSSISRHAPIVKRQNRMGG